MLNVLRLLQKMFNTKKGNNMKGYLAHPFDTRHWLREWELKFEKATGIEIVNPFYDITRDDVEPIDAGRAERYEHLIASDLVNRDVDCIKACDFVVAFVTGDLSYGTIMEIVYAFINKIPVYIICTNGHEQHPWLQYHGKHVFTTIEFFEHFIRGIANDIN